MTERCNICPHQVCLTSGDRRVVWRVGSDQPYFSSDRIDDCRSRQVILGDDLVSSPRFNDSVKDAKKRTEST